MAFTGIFEAPKITPSEFGLFTVAKPETQFKEDQWIRGFSQEWDTSIYSAKNWDDTDTTSAVVASNATPTRYTEINPFFIEAEDYRSTLGFAGFDYVARVKRQLEGITQKAMEREIWDGAIRKGESHANKALSASTATLINGTTALSVARALALLDFELADTSPAGENGVIHMTKDAAGLLSANYMIFHNVETGHLQTISGTKIIIGSGYTGNGPDTQTGATASATNKWMYGTGTVKVFLGDVDVVADTLAQSYDVAGNQNDMRIKAIRPAAVYFDPSIHLAVRVDLTA
ncbi:MAG: hypothetical protein EBU08_05400 [Micrococcales bacterium]|nr:hypothetical protein [Micrococcales bacterium]